MLGLVLLWMYLYPLSGNLFLIHLLTNQLTYQLQNPPPPLIPLLFPCFYCLLPPLSHLLTSPFSSYPNLKPTHSPLFKSSSSSHPHSTIPTLKKRITTINTLTCVPIAHLHMIQKTLPLSLSPLPLHIKRHQYPHPLPHSHPRSSTNLPFTPQLPPYSSQQLPTLYTSL